MYVFMKIACNWHKRTPKKKNLESNKYKSCEIYIRHIYNFAEKLEQKRFQQAKKHISNNFFTGFLAEINILSPFD